MLNFELELEYGKASRGTLTLVSEDYAWGNHSWYLQRIFAVLKTSWQAILIVSAAGTCLRTAVPFFELGRLLQLNDMFNIDGSNS